MKRAIQLKHKNYLQVSIDLPAAKVARFVRLMKKLMPMFTSPVPTDSAEDLTFGWTLVAALQTPQGRRNVRITHLWQVDPAKPPMTDVMGACGMDKSYAALDMLVDREVQNYMYGNNEYLPDGATWPERQPQTIAVETLQVTRDPDRLQQFEVGGSLLSDSGMEALAARAQEKHGWTLLLPLTPQTGLLRQYVHFWGVGKGGTTEAGKVRKWLQGQPEYVAGVESTDIITGTPLPYHRAAPRG